MWKHNIQDVVLAVITTFRSNVPLKWTSFCNKIFFVNYSSLLQRLLLAIQSQDSFSKHLLLLMPNRLINASLHRYTPLISSSKITRRKHGSGGTWQAKIKQRDDHQLTATRSHPFVATSLIKSIPTSKNTAISIAARVPDLFPTTWHLFVYSESNKKSYEYELHSSRN